METRTKGWTNEAFHRQKGLSIDHGFHDFPAGRRSGSERFYFVFDGELSNESLSTTMSRSYDEESCFFFWGRGRWIDDFSFQTMPVMECIYSLNTGEFERSEMYSFYYENYRELTKESLLRGRKKIFCSLKLLNELNCSLL